MKLKFLVFMEVIIEKNKESKKIEFDGTVNNLLKKLKINSETVITIRNNELLTEEDIVNNYDTIKILSVVSGG